MIRRAAFPLTLCLLLPGVAHTADASGLEPARESVSYREGCAVYPSDGPGGSPAMAAVLGEPGEHLALHRKMPGDCKAGDRACDGRAYLIAGDLVSLQASCGSWTAVQFAGPSRTSRGWVETARLASRVSAPGLTDADTDEEEAQEEEGAGVSVRCDSAHESLTIEPFHPHKVLELANFLEVLRVHGSSADCRWDGGAHLRVRYGRFQAWPYGEGGACPVSYFSVWHQQARWLSAQKVDGYFQDPQGRRLSRLVVSPAGITRCTLPPTRCDEPMLDGDADDGQDDPSKDHERCESLPAATLSASPDAREYAPAGTTHVLAGAMVLLESHDQTLCPAFMTSRTLGLGGEGSLLPEGVALPTPLSSPPVTADPAHPAPTLAGPWYHFDARNSGGRDWVLAGGQSTHAHDGDDLYLFSDEALNRLKAGSKTEREVEADAVAVLPYAWVSCPDLAPSSVPSASGCVPPDNLSFGVRNFEGGSTSLGTSFLDIEPFFYRNQTFMLISGRGAHDGENQHWVVKPRQQGVPQLICAFEQVPAHF